MKPCHGNRDRIYLTKLSHVPCVSHPNLLVILMERMSFPWRGFLSMQTSKIGQMNCCISNQLLFSFYAEDKLERLGSCTKTDLGIDLGNESPPQCYLQQFRETVGVHKILLQNNTCPALWTQLPEVKAPFNADFGESLKQFLYPSPKSLGCHAFRDGQFIWA